MEHSSSQHYFTSGGITKQILNSGNSWTFVLPSKTYEMGNRLRKGGAMGRHHGRGKIYIMKSGSRTYKIGCSKDPNRRLREIKRQKPRAKLYKTFKAREMNRAESAAQRANLRMGSKKAKKGPTDWFTKERRKPWKDVAKTTANAVYRHNRIMKTRRSGRR
ncbi:uncharacterized protein LOC125673587 [Ostrea edulis]|uniref:uncharacterized protein LOC125673587 n=1 Tax=Ostrea edulis TaxID=37623 RepID=UPI0024AF5E6F|nr:uncharacterized protein LOC125673587 [Ostrea edulis]